MSTDEMTKYQLVRRSTHASPQRLRAFSAFTATGSATAVFGSSVAGAVLITSGITDPRVQDRVQQVDEQAHEEVDQHQDGDQAHQGGALAPDDRLVDGAADAL